MAAKRTRTRRLRSDIDWVARALRFMKEDEAARTDEMNARLQRYAKFRQWTEGGGERWDGSSDAAVPDLATASLRMQDSVINAVRGMRPAVTSEATHEKDKDRQDNVDHLLDYQAFIENGQDGASWLDSITENWTNDGHYTLFIPWVSETREIVSVTLYDPIPEGEVPAQYFAALLQQKYQGYQIIPKTGDDFAAWDFVLQAPPAGQGKAPPPPFTVAFYTTPTGQVEMVETKAQTVFEGPKLIAKDRADVLHAPYVENLQAPGPSNPNGAGHVILVDRPTVEEIARLQKSGWYDRITKADIEKMRKAPLKQESVTKDQKIVMGGMQARPLAQPEPDGQERVTRLMVFDMVDIDGDGVAEDVVYWVIVETEELLRIRRLTEVFPHRRGRRPFAEAAFIRVAGQRTGVGLLELGEGLHDTRKATTDLMIDQGNLLLSPFFFYRPNSNIKEEQIALAPGEGYPLSNPSQDVAFPTLPASGQAFAINFLTLLQQDEERLTMVTDLGLGRVPQGKSSALRTSDNMAAILQQQEARPEHLLHNFFSGLAQAWEIMHELNLAYLDGDKAIRIFTALDDSENPFKVITPDDLKGTFDFSFQANAFNTSRASMQAALSALMPVLLSPLTLQAGLVNAQTVYKVIEDYGQAWGQKPTRKGWLNKPMMGSVTAEEAILAIMNDQFPNGMPAEGFPAHAYALQSFMQSEQFGYLSQQQVVLFQQWLQQLQQMQMMMQAQQAAMAAASQGQEGAPGQKTKPGPEGARTGAGGNPQVQPNEMLNETMPTAGGGANAGHA